MKVEPAEEGLWKPCPPGMLVGIARRRRVLRGVRVAGTALMVMMGVGMGLMMFHPFGWGEFHSGGIACHQVRQAMPEYLNGTLAPDKRLSVERHLAECPLCWMMHRKEQPPGMSQLPRKGSLGGSGHDSLVAQQTHRVAANSVVVSLAAEE